MPSLILRFTDKNARLILPSRFANSFTEEQRPPLSDEDRDFLLSLLAAPPKANADLEKAAREHRRRDG